MQHNDDSIGTYNLHDIVTILQGLISAMQTGTDLSNFINAARNNFLTVLKNLYDTDSQSAKTQIASLDAKLRILRARGCLNISSSKLATIMQDLKTGATHLKSILPENLREKMLAHLKQTTSSKTLARTNLGVFSVKMSTGLQQEDRGILLLQDKLSPAMIREEIKKTALIDEAGCSYAKAVNLSRKAHAHCVANNSPAAIECYEEALSVLDTIPDNLLTSAETALFVEYHREAAYHYLALAIEAYFNASYEDGLLKLARVDSHLLEILPESSKDERTTRIQLVSSYIQQLFDAEASLLKVDIQDTEKRCEILRAMAKILFDLSSEYLSRKRSVHGLKFSTKGLSTLTYIPQEHKIENDLRLTANLISNSVHCHLIEAFTHFLKQEYLPAINLYETIAAPLINTLETTYMEHLNPVHKNSLLMQKTEALRNLATAHHERARACLKDGNTDLARTHALRAAEVITSVKQNVMASDMQLLKDINTTLSEINSPSLETEPANRFTHK